MPPIIARQVPNVIVRFFALSQEAGPEHSRSDSRLIALAATRRYPRGWQCLWLCRTVLRKVNDMLFMLRIVFREDQGDALLAYFDEHGLTRYEAGVEIRGAWASREMRTVYVVAEAEFDFASRDTLAAQNKNDFFAAPIRNRITGHNRNLKVFFADKGDLDEHAGF